MRKREEGRNLGAWGCIRCWWSGRGPVEGLWPPCPHPAAGPWGVPKKAAALDLEGGGRLQTWTRLSRRVWARCVHGAPSRLMLPPLRPPPLLLSCLCFPVVGCLSLAPFRPAVLWSWPLLFPTACGCRVPA